MGGGGGGEDKALGSTSGSVEGCDRAGNHYVNIYNDVMHVCAANMSTCHQFFIDLALVVPRDDRHLDCSGQHQPRH